jgi:predicted transcriptional regulator
VESDPQTPAEFVERFAAVLTEAGIPRMPARVFVALLVTDSGYLSASQLSRMLRISPAAVSGAVRYLIQVDLVSREREPGSRRDRYRVLDDVWYQSASRRDQVLARWDSIARQGIDILGRETPAGRRFAESVEFFEFLQKEIPAVMAKWQAHRAGVPAQDEG